MFRMNIAPQNLEEIEQFLAQSINGHHHLFDNLAIARVLQKPTEELDFFSFENMDRIQNLFTELIGKKGYAEKLSYIDSLDTESFEILLRTYFHILENTLLSASEFRH